MTKDSSARYSLYPISGGPRLGSFAGRASLGERGRRVGGGRHLDGGVRLGVYNIQRIYLDFVEALEISEETVPGAEGGST